MSPVLSRVTPSGSVVWVLVLAGVLAGSLLWRLPATVSEWRFTLCENDSLYQLHRVQDCLRQYPHVPSVDRYSHYPAGYRVPWLALHSLFYATVARLAGLTADERDALIRVLSWIPPVFGLLAVLLSVAIARYFTDDRRCLGAIGFLCAFSPDVCRPFFFGTIDHHLFAHVGTLLCVWGRLSQRRAGWLFGLVALIAMTPEAILYVSLLLVCLFASELAAIVCGCDQRRIGGFWFLSPSVVAVVVVAVQRYLETAPLPLTDLSWTYPTLFQPLWMAALGGSALTVLIGLGRGLRVRRGAGRVALGVVGALAVVVATCVTLLLWSGGFDTIVGRMLVSNRIFVSEEAPVFHAGLWATPGWYRVLALSGLFLIAESVVAARRRATADEWFRWIVVVAALAFGFKEYRHLYVLSSLQLIGLGVAAFETVGALQRLPIFGGRATQWLPAGAMVLAIVPIFYTTAISNRVAIHGDSCARMPVITEVTDWLRTYTPDAAPDGEAAPSYGVFSPWSIGHHIRVLADRAVIVDPFNYDTTSTTEHTLESTWRSRTADELAAALRAQPARYLVLTNPAEEIVSTLQRRGIPPDAFLTFDAGGAPVLRPAMNQFASFRLFMTSGWSGEFGQLQPRFFSSDAEVYTAGSDSGEARRIAVPKGQIYELKPGAVLTGAQPPATGAMTISYVVRLRDAPPTEVRLPLPVSSDSRFEFHTALPAPVEEDSFRVEGGYRITAGDWNVEVSVTQTMVDSHATIPIEWPVRH